MNLALAMVPVRRVLRLRSSRSSLAGIAILAALLATLRHVSTEATLQGAFEQALGGILVPLTALSIVTASLAGQDLTSITRLAYPFGGGRGRSAWLVSLSTGIVAALVGGALALTFGMAVHANASGVALADAVTAAWVAGLSCLTYGAILLFVSTLPAASFMRVLFLIIDLALGSGTSIVAAMFPRSHTRSLLGGSPVAGLGQHSSAAILVGLALLLLALVALRQRRAR